MPERLRRLWDDARRGLWLLPSLCVLGAIALSTGLLLVDAAVPGLGAELPLVFGGTPEGARTLLATVAGSVVTVAAVAFSVTMIALQQASTQYTPRVLRTFTEDLGNQVVLGVLLGTFTYALLVLRQVRSPVDGEAGFMPGLSITACVALALASIAVLVFFIHHTAESLSVTHLLASIRRDLDPEIERHFPRAFGERGRDPQAFEELLAATAGRRDGAETAVESRDEGFLRAVDEARLGAALPDGARFAVVPVRIGEYVHRGHALVRVWAAPPLDGPAQDAVRRSFVLAHTRTIAQDPLFGVRQLADIGVKALSPGIHDPTTAEHALEHLGGALARLLERGLPDPLRRLRGRECLVLFHVPSLGDYLAEAFDQIRRFAAAQPRVLLQLLDVLAMLARHVPAAERAGPLLLQTRAVVRTAQPPAGEPEAAQAVRERAGQVLALLERRLDGLARAGRAAAPEESPDDRLPP